MAFRKTQNDSNAGRLFRHFIQGEFDLLQEMRLVHQVFRWIPAEGQFWKYHGMGFKCVLGAGGGFQDTANIAGDVADEKIDLGDGDA